MKRISKKADLIVKWVLKTSLECLQEIKEIDMKGVDLDTKKIQKMIQRRASLIMMNDNKIIDFY